MFTFLRKIRRSLIESGSTRKYLLYAIGEIALVVIGILIALQINNWNTSRIEKKEELEIVSHLHVELNLNISHCLEMLSEVRRVMNSARILMSYTGSSPKTISSDTFFMHSMVIENYPPFVPKVTTLSEIANSDRIHIIRNGNLKNDLLEYLVKIERGRQNYNVTLDYWNSIQAPFLVANSNRLSILGAFDKYDLPPSGFSVDISRILSNPKFENIVADVYWLMTYNETSYFQIQEAAEELIDSIEENYPRLQ